MKYYLLNIIYIPFFIFSLVCFYNHIISKFSDLRAILKTMNDRNMYIKFYKEKKKRAQLSKIFSFLFLND